MMLRGKTREQIEHALHGKDRSQLIDIIFFLATFEPLLTVREIADASHVSKRDVLEAIKRGEFNEPMLGAGFFCRGKKSLRVSRSAANAWRRSFFVRVSRTSSNGPAKKSGAPAGQIVVEGQNFEANAPAFAHEQEG
jgi:hypothetical protein